MSMNYLDLQYVSLVSARLQNFSTKKSGLYNFRCPYCGDSAKRKSKARGYLFSTKTGLVFKCHNCGVSKAFFNFLQDQDKVLWEQYNLEKFKESSGSRKRQVVTPKFKKPVFKKKKTVNLPTISELNRGHPAREYLERREIPDLSKFYYAEKFKEWTNTLKPTYQSSDSEESRIIIPLLDEEGNLFGYQGRSLNPKDKLRYVTVMLEEDVPKVYGLSDVDKTKTVYVLEGPLDAAFIPQAIAMCGADVHLGSRGISDTVWIYDNEPRNPQIVGRMGKTIASGDAIVIWPSNIKQKDINDMILARHNVLDVIESNTYKGLEATVKLSEWKRCK